MTGAAAQELQTLEEEWNVLSKGVTDLGIAVVQVARRAAERAQRPGAGGPDDRADIAGSRGESGSRTSSPRKRRSPRRSSSSAKILGSWRACTRSSPGVEARRSAGGGSDRWSAGGDPPIELAIKDQRRTHDDSLRLTHEHELQLQDLRAKAEHIRARAQEEFELTVELKTYPPRRIRRFCRAARRDPGAARQDQVARQHQLRRVRGVHGGEAAARIPLDAAARICSKRRRRCWRRSKRSTRRRRRSSWRPSRRSGRTSSRRSRASSIRATNAT